MIFGSKTPRDLNHDPEPFVSHHGRHEDADPSGWDFDVEFTLAPRREFDHIQHNEPNPILVEFREDFDGDMRGWGVWLALASDEMTKDDRATIYHREHARRVLARLARFAS